MSIAGQIVAVVVAVLAIVGGMWFMKRGSSPAKAPTPTNAAPASKTGKAKGRRGSDAGDGAAPAGAGSGASTAAAGGGGSGASISHLLKQQKSKKAQQPAHPLFIRTVKSAGGDATCFGTCVPVAVLRSVVVARGDGG